MLLTERERERIIQKQKSILENQQLDTSTLKASHSLHRLTIISGDSVKLSLIDDTASLASSLLLHCRDTLVI